MSYAIVGEQILKFRKEKGLTQRELGERIGVSSSAVSQWEGGGTPDISLLPILSDVLGVTVDALFGRTGIERENLAEVLGGYVASLPEEKRLGETVSLMRKAVTAGFMGELTSAVNMEDHDSEETYIFRDGAITHISVKDRSFLSAIHTHGEGGLKDLFSFDERICQLFSVLADPQALTMLVDLCQEESKYRTAGALALTAGITQKEAEAILSKFTQLRLTEELALETEEGGVTAYKVDLNGSSCPAIPLLASARLMTEERTTGIKLVIDKREPALRADTNNGRE